MKFKIIEVPKGANLGLVGRDYAAFSVAIIGWGREAMGAIAKLEALPVGYRINDPEGGVWERIA